MKQLAHWLHNEKGQVMAENILMLVLIVAAVIMAVVLLGPAIANKI